MTMIRPFAAATAALAVISWNAVTPSLALASTTRAAAAVSCTGTSLVQDSVISGDKLRVPTVGNATGNWHCELGPGNAGVAVARLQIGLDDVCNLSAGLTVDGDYGPLTQQAVINVQKARHIPADGIYGPVTAASMAWPVAGSDGKFCGFIQT